MEQYNFPKEVLIKTISNLLYVNLLTLLFFACGNRDKNIVIESFENGKPKLEFISFDKNTGLSCYKTYFKTGSVQSEFCLDEDENLEGKVVNYYESEKIDAIRNYINGNAHGDCFFYDEEGRLIQYVLYHDGEPVYRKDYKYDYDGVEESEGFIPVVQVERDTFQKIPALLKFRVSLPVPDSLLNGKEFFFAYQMLPLNMKGKDFTDPVYQIELHSTKSAACDLILESAELQLFYGHLNCYEGDIKHIFYPYEKEITFLTE